VGRCHDDLIHALPLGGVGGYVRLVKQRVEAIAEIFGGGDTFTGTLPTRIVVAAIRRRIRSAMTNASPASVSGSKQQNSSPPSRNKKSPGRILLRAMATTRDPRRMLAP
jgi:hypothetical protein